MVEEGKKFSTSSPQEFHYLVCNLSDNWEKLARHGLDLPKSVVAQAKIKHSDDLQGRARYVIDEWEEKNGSEATDYAMICALRKVGLESLAQEIEQPGITPESSTAEIRQRFGYSYNRRPIRQEVQGSCTDTFSTRDPCTLGDASMDNATNRILIWHDDKDEESRRFVQQIILEPSDVQDVCFVSRWAHLSDKQESMPQTPTPVAKGLIQRAIDTVKGNRNITVQDELSATYTGVAVVLSSNTQYEAPEDKELLDNISNEFEKGSLTVMCIKMKETIVVPPQLRCSCTVDYKTNRFCWQESIWRTLSDNTPLDRYQESSADIERAGEEPDCGSYDSEDDDDSSDNDQSPIEGRIMQERDSKLFPTPYFTVDCRNLTLHKTIESLASTFVSPEMLYGISLIQLICGFIYWGSTSLDEPSNNLKGQTFVFLIFIYIPLRSLLPLGGVAWLNQQRILQNKPPPIKFSRDVALSLIHI